MKFHLLDDSDRDMRLSKNLLNLLPALHQPSLQSEQEGSDSADRHMNNTLLPSNVVSNFSRLIFNLIGLREKSRRC